MKAGEIYWELFTDLKKEAVPEWVMKEIARCIENGEFDGFVQFEYEQENEGE